MALRFTPTQAQKQRRRERRFFVQLALFCLIGALPVLILFHRHELAYRHTQAANHLLEAELQALAPRLQAASKASADISAVQAREQAAADMARHRLEAPQLLQALSAASLPGIRLHAITLRQHHVLVRAYANDQQDIARFSELLADSSLGHAALQDLRAKSNDKKSGDSRNSDAGQYDVTFSIDLPAHVDRPKEAP